MGGPIVVARTIHMFSAFWTLALAVLIVCDVIGRGVFTQPIPGTKEIVQNSVVTITFLQLPLAIYSGAMLRTSIFADAMPPFIQKLLRSVCMILGMAFFLALLWSTWPSFMDAYRIGEYEGEGALRVPTWPVRGTILILAVFGCWAYLTMLVFDWQGKLIDDEEAPGSLPPHLVEKKV